MRRLLPLSVLVLTTSLLAQGSVRPFHILQTNPLPSLSPGVIPGTQVQQVCMVHLANDPPHIHLCAMTVISLSGYGSAGGSDLLTGTYDALADVFTPNSDAAALNTTGTEFGLQVHSNGLLAVFDRLPGLPHLASRTTVNQPWVDLGAIAGLPTQSYFDPSIADYHGQTWLLHVLGTGIAITPINTTAPATTGPSIAIALSSVTGSTANSPTPILDSNNQLIGLSHHDTIAAENDHYLSLDLDPATPAVMFWDTTTWRNNGDYIGGRFFDAESISASYNIFTMDTFWCPGGRAQIGGTMSIDFYAPPTSNSSTLYLSALLIGSGFLATPITVPGVPGLLGINPVGATWLGLFLHNNANGTANTSFAIPNNPSLHNINLASQSATMDVATGVMALANTFALIVE